MSERPLYRDLLRKMVLLAIPGMVEQILSTYLTIHVWQLSLREVWYCMIADNVFKALFLTAPYITGRLTAERTAR